MNDETINDELPIGARSVPEETDYKAVHILGAKIVGEILPEEVNMYTIPGNQGSSVKCTCYSTSHAGKLLNEIEHQIKELKAKYDVQWDKQALFKTMNSSGDLVQTAIKNIVKNGLETDNGKYYFDGYASIEHKDIHYWLAKGYPVITSGNVTNTNFKKAKTTGYWGGNDGTPIGGHAFMLCGYDKEGAITTLNSYGPDWGFYKNGTFKISLDRMEDLDTCYILYDKKDSTPIFRDVTTASPFAEDIKYMLDAGYMKGYDESLPPEQRFFMPDKPITRAELAATLHRILTMRPLN